MFKTYNENWFEVTRNISNYPELEHYPRTLDWLLEYLEKRLDVVEVPRAAIEMLVVCDLMKSASLMINGENAKLSKEIFWHQLKKFIWCEILGSSQRRPSTSIELNDFLN